MATKGTHKKVASPEEQSGTLEGFEDRMVRRALDLISHPEKLEAAQGEVVGNPITLGPRVVSAADWAEDQVTAAKNKAAKWLERSRRPKKVPSTAALAAKGKYRNKLEEALAGGYWEAAMGRVDEDLRMLIIEAVGATGFSQGIERHKPKVVARVKELQPLVLALAQEIDAMPQVTDDEREARMLAAKRGMQRIGRVRKGLS